MLMVMFGLALGACASRPPSYADLSPAELAAWMADEDVMLVNTHIPYEGEIAETDAFLPYDEIGSLLDQLPEDRSAPLVLYCRSGRMSAIAADTLSELGFTNLYNLDGGMIAWEQAGYSLESQ
jgi:rhodanese-related sulfurtransferase